MMSNFVSLKYYSRKRINELLELIGKIKKAPGRYSRNLKGSTVGLFFEKPSLRTKTSFYVGALQLGANAVYYSPSEVQLGDRESVTDAARTISRYIDCAVLRTFSHDTILKFVKASTIPVVNALSDLLHPSQALADVFTICECKKNIKKIKFAFIGDGNNVCHSLMYAFSILGGHLHIATPKKYAPGKDVFEEVTQFVKISGGAVTLCHDAEEAAAKADVIYTDVWASMGEEAEKKIKVKEFGKFQVNGDLMKLAKKDCVIMHCLPAHRGEEITDEVIESKNSIVFLQAENRMHTAKALLLCLLGGKK